MGNKNQNDSLIKLDVILFDNFQISSDEKILEEKDIRSDMVTKLLVYMVLHRNGNVSLQELSDVLWGDEGCDNPLGALKNLMYRLRNILKKNLGDYPFIITGRGYYRWNEEIQLTIDVEEFEKYCKMAEEEKDIGKKIGYELEADSYYREKFLPQYIDKYWVMSLSVYYHSLYLNMVKELAKNLEIEKRFFEMEEVCHNALAIDELDEDLHYYFIRALVSQNKQNMAVEHYKKTSDLLYDSLGIRPSERLRGVYDDLMKQQHTTEMDIGIIKSELASAKDGRKGAFFCDYGVFKKNYELEVRRAKRLGISVYLGLITVTPQLNLKLDSPAYVNTVKLGVKQMQNILMGALRSGDVITRYSAAQFILMLPACKYEDAVHVMERILGRFDQLDHKARVKIMYSLEELDTE